MVQAMRAFFNYAHGALAELSGRQTDVPKPQEYRVGAYLADYTPLKPEDLASDAELEELYKHSKPISR